MENSLASISLYDCFFPRRMPRLCLQRHLRLHEGGIYARAELQPSIPLKSLTFR